MNDAVDGRSEFFEGNDALFASSAMATPALRIAMVVPSAGIQSELADVVECLRRLTFVEIQVVLEVAASCSGSRPVQYCTDSIGLVTQSRIDAVGGARL